MCRYLHSRSRLGNRHSIILYTILPGSTGRGATASATDPHQLAQQFPRLRPVTDAICAKRKVEPTQAAIARWRQDADTQRYLKAFAKLRRARHA